jgi:2-polyprenyl-3-methyl-5-hydroxy-6-metoxy-1,4-benzoquinol methylase
LGIALPNKITYCFDIDGTLCNNTEGEYADAKPFLDRIAVVNKLFEEGNQILLLTARGATTGIDWRKLTEKQMLKWGVRYHELYLTKPTAHIYIDDKAFNSETWDWNANVGFSPEAGRESIMEKSSYLEVTYDQERASFGPYPLQLAGWISDNHLGNKGRLLDMGCGRGEFLSAFDKLGFKVAGTDVSPSAPSLSPSFDVRVANLDTQPMPFDKESFDVVFSKSVIEHTHTPTVMLQKAFDTLVPGGLAVVMTPSWSHTYWGPFYCDHTHVTPFTVLSLKDALTLVGFENAQVKHFIQLPSVWKYPFLKPLIYLIRKLPLPFRPHMAAPWPEGLNKFIRFSNEVMLLAIARKPLLGKGIN